MKIIPIFDSKYEKSDCILWSVVYDGETEDEFKRLFNLWNDITYLRDFFNTNIHILNSDFWQTMTIDNAISKAIREATILADKILIIEENCQLGDWDELDKIFKGLHKELHSPYSVKAKLKRHKPFLRLYGLETEDNCIIITGGGIKLTEKMQQDDLLKIELEKLNIVKQFLKDKGITIISEYGTEE